MKAIRIHTPGGPHVMQLQEITIADPGAGEIQLRHTAIGLNFIDVYFRTGLYPAPELPFTPGFEGAGIVVAVGDGVTDLKVGDRVATNTRPPGAYAEQRNVAADRVVPLPQDIDDDTAAAIMLKGMTAEYLVQRTYPVTAADTLLVYAAAGGVGQLLTQWAHSLGATVIAVVGNDAKAQIARNCGADYVINHHRDNLVDTVKTVTDGRGVNVVYDAVGQATFEASLDCLTPRGTMVSYGNASGAVGTFNPMLLSAKGSLYLTRPTLFDYTNTRADLLNSAAAVFKRIRSGILKPHIGQTYTLADIATAHRDLEAGNTTGCTVIHP